MQFIKNSRYLLANSVWYTFILLLKIGGIRGTSLPEFCNLEKLCIGHKNEVKFPDPGNCHNYVTCEKKDRDGILSYKRHQCPENKFFNFDLQTCEEENGNLQCSDPCPGEFDLSLFDQESLNPNLNIDVCDPFISCGNSTLGYKVPNPDDCRSYFLCIENRTGFVLPSDNSVKCEQGFFNVTSLECEGTNQDSCDEPCLNVGCIFECYLESPSSPYLIADPNNCSRFTTCTPGLNKIPGDCPLDKPYFDGLQCTDNKYSCCDSCEPYCELPFTQTIDPKDCSKYYLCEETGTPSEKTHYPCPANTYFEPKRGMCVDDEGVLCTSRCSINRTKLK